MARFKAKQLDARGRAARAELGPRRGADAAAAAARRHRRRAAHRLREHREPAARARGGARQRDGGAPVDRRQPAAAARAAAHRVVPARGRSAASPVCWSRAGRSTSSRSLLPADAAATLPSTLEPHGAALRRRRCRSARAALRPVPGAAQHAARSRLDAQGPGGPAVGRARGAALPHDARHGADRAVDGAARRRPACSPRAWSTSAASTSASSVDNVVTFGVSPELNGYTSRAIARSSSSGSKTSSRRCRA